jgi:hypothetical protein
MLTCSYVKYWKYFLSRECGRFNGVYPKFFVSFASVDVDIIYKSDKISRRCFEVQNI